MEDQISKMLNLMGKKGLKPPLGKCALASILLLVSSFWTPTLNAKSPEQAVSEVQEQLQKLESELKPEKTGDAFLDDILSDWYLFSTDEIRRVLQQFKGADPGLQSTQPAIPQKNAEDEGKTQENP